MAAQESASVESCASCRMGRRLRCETCITLTWWSSTIVVRHVPVAYCEYCGEESYDEVTTDLLQRLLTAAVDAGTEMTMSDYPHRVAVSAAKLYSVK